MNKKIIKPSKKVKEIKKLAKRLEIEDVVEIQAGIMPVVNKPKFVYGDYITDAQTGKTFAYNHQNKVDEDPDRYILIAPNL
jgi:hypothetical protein